MAYVVAPDFPIMALSLSLDRPGQTNASAWTGKRTVVSNPWHGKWSGHVQLATQQDESTFRPYRSFLAKVKGTLNSFRVYATAGPQNGNSGVSLSANAAAGATSISITGATTPLGDGQFFTLNGQLCCCTADQSGSALTFEPPLRQAASAGTIVVTSRPYLLAYMVDSKFSYDIGPWRRFGVAFDIEEAILETDGSPPESAVFAPPLDTILQEDGSHILMEDGTSRILTE